MSLDILKINQTHFLKAYHATVLWFFPKNRFLSNYIFLVLRDHWLYVIYLWKKNSAHALGASVVWYLSLPLINSFNKTEAAIFPCRLCFLRGFSFISLIYFVINMILCNEKSNKSKILPGSIVFIRYQRCHIFNTFYDFHRLLCRHEIIGCIVRIS